jgi:hypothetical protein
VFCVALHVLVECMSWFCVAENVVVEYELVLYG